MKDQDRAEIEAQGALGCGLDEDELRGPFTIGDYKKLQEERDGLERYVDMLRQRQREIQDRCICDDEEHDRSDARFARLIEKHKTKEAFLFNRIRKGTDERDALLKANAELQATVDGLQLQIKDMQYSIGTAIALSTPMPSSMSNGM